MVTIDFREHHLVECLVQNAGDSKYQDGPAVTEHPLQQRPVKLIFDTCQLLPEEECDDSRACQIDKEGIAYTHVGIVDGAHGIGIKLVQRWQDDEV